MNGVYSMFHLGFFISIIVIGFKTEHNIQYIKIYVCPDGYTRMMLLNNSQSSGTKRGQ